MKQEKKNNLYQSSMALVDNYNRVHNYVRISLTDKCNLNCIYCNPATASVLSLSNRFILSYEELYRLIEIFVRELGITKIRFTGGEPLIRKDVLKFFEMVSILKKQYNFEIGITTNGTNLLEKLESLYNLGVDSLNISLDTLNKDKFIAITGRTCFDEVFESICRAAGIGFKSVKVNVVVMKGVNDDELISFIDCFKSLPLTIRFIEYMPFTGNRWEDTKFLSWRDMKSGIENTYKLLEIESRGKVSKDYKVIGTNLKIGFISSISDHFCDSCNRLRITASGHIKNCLFSNSSELSLKPLLADKNIKDEVIAAFIKDSLKTKWFKHPDVSELVSLKQNNMMSIGG